MINIERKTLSAKDFWLNLDKFKTVFPELSDRFDKALTHVNSASCSGCAKNSTKAALIRAMAALRKSDGRPIPVEIRELMGPEFARVLADGGTSRPYGTLEMPVGDGTKTIIERPPIHSHFSPGWRVSCLDCVRKHLAQALILFQEYQSDSDTYAAHFWLGVGHLAEAESELLGTWASKAKWVREMRLAIMNDRNFQPDLTAVIKDVDSLDAYEPTAI
jgi:hypothetical protein